VQPPYAALNPNMLVPTLQDEDFILTENSAILKYLADAITIADYHAASYVALAEVIGSDLSVYPNVDRSLPRMKALKSWPQVYEVIDGFAASLKDRSMVAV
jgi:glutathione S-transferase